MQVERRAYVYDPQRKDSTMSSNIKNMTRGKPGKLIFTFAIPLMAGNIFQQLYTVVDTMVVGKFLGVNALAALGASDWLNWMMLGIIQGFTQGFAIKMAQDFGAGDHASLRKTIGTSEILAVVFSVFLVIVGQLTARPILLSTAELPGRGSAFGACSVLRVFAYVSAPVCGHP